MKKMLFCSILLVFTACKDRESVDINAKDGVDGKNGTVLTLSRTEGGVVISSSDGTSVELHDGAQGPQGVAGPVGPTGPKGATGAQGEPGLNGADGKQGPQGVAGVDGAPGKDGVDGKDGESGSVKTVTTVPSGQCVKIGENLWAENIRNGEVYDVYYNNKCQDKSGEHCDNVVPSFGSSGTLGAGEPGSGTICSINGDLIFGNLSDNNSLVITLIKFK